MAILTIRNIDHATNMRLRLRAARNDRSMEAEALDILRSALSIETTRARNLGEAIHERFGPLGVDLPAVPREPIRQSTDFRA